MIDIVFGFFILTKHNLFSAKKRGKTQPQNPQLTAGLSKIERTT